MKNNLNLILAFLFLLLFSCRKEDTVNKDQSQQSFSVGDAKILYRNIQKDNITSKKFQAVFNSTPNWKLAEIVRNSSGYCIIVPMSEIKAVTRFSDSTKKLGTPAVVFENIKGEWKANVLLFQSPSVTQTGSLIHYNLASGCGTYYNLAPSIKTELAPLIPAAGYLVCSETEWYSCTIVKNVNYGCYYNYTSVQCLDAPESTGGSTSSPGDGGGPYNTGLNYINFVAPPLPSKIIKIGDYIKCFTNSGSSIYTVKLCVKQPKPGSRAKVADNMGNTDIATLNPTSLTVGHTFLTLKQTGQSSAANITRSIGYYPESFVKPAAPSGFGVYADDSQENYDVAVTYSVSATTFFQILSTLNSGVSGTYDLSSNNCTSVCLDVLEKAGLTVPRTVGTWPLGQGYNPADLGEDLRALPLSGNVVGKDFTSQSPQNSSPCKMLVL